MRQWRLSSALAIIVLTFGTLVATASGAAASPYSMEQEFISKINSERASRGLKKLAAKSDLRNVARNHSADMAAEGDIWHNPNLSKQVGGNWTVLGENVGMGGSVNSLHKAFMDSPGHRANVLHKSFNQIGVGVKIGDDGTIYVTEVFAKRGSTKKSSSSSSKASAPKKSSSSSKASSSKASAPKSSGGSSSGSSKKASKPAPKPKPAPEPAAEPRNVDMLVHLLGLDARDVDPATGLALGG